MGGTGFPEEDLVSFGLVLDDLPKDDLDAFYRRANGLGLYFEERAWLGIARLFYAAATLGEQVVRGQETASWVEELTTFADQTAPTGQKLDDAGVAMAWVMPVIDSPKTSEGERAAWSRFLSVVAAEVRRRQGELHGGA